MPPKAKKQKHGTRSSNTMMELDVCKRSSASSKVASSIIVVQKAWRKTFRFNQTHKVVNTFLKEGPTIQYVKSIRSAYHIFKKMILSI